MNYFLVLEGDNEGRSGPLSQDDALRALAAYQTRVKKEGYTYEGSTGHYVKAAPFQDYETWTNAHIEDEARWIMTTAWLEESAATAPEGEEAPKVWRRRIYCPVCQQEYYQPIGGYEDHQPVFCDVHQIEMLSASEWEALLKDQNAKLDRGHAA